MADSVGGGGGESVGDNELRDAIAAAVKNIAYDHRNAYVVADVLLPLVVAEVRSAAATAWDSGYAAGEERTNEWWGSTGNPYRVEETPPAECCEKRPCGENLLHQDDCPVYLAVLADTEFQPVPAEVSPVQITMLTNVINGSCAYSEAEIEALRWMRWMYHGRPRDMCGWPYPCAHRAYNPECNHPIANPKASS